ncbi:MULTISPECIES: glycosyltransferase [Actinoplanes]|uniref:glycosyltransferase family 8 protein n=1 Tax=Actinoplanes TaxID=1865 RepID=UPI0005F27786|nr:MULTISPECIES: glycosyltransferase [Actinoplanes]GLY06985.1 general stress protein A [Actinoplanes sp. NBRC 101535]
MFKKRDVRLVTAVDRGHLPFLAVLVESLGRSQRSGRPVTLTVLHTGVSETDRDQVAVAAGPVELRWQDVTRRDPDDLVARPHYFRCLLPSVLTDRRVIYLDADTLVRADLGRLWDLDLRGAPVGAVNDPLGADGTFDAGVMLIDLEAWRAVDAGRSAVQHCSMAAADLIASGRWSTHEQYGLNVVFQQRWRRIDDEWNYFTFRPYRLAAVLHFAGNGRPGSRYCDPRWTAEFAAAVDRTPWHGWRPETTMAAVS